MNFLFENQCTKLRSRTLLSQMRIVIEERGKCRFNYEISTSTGTFHKNVSLHKRTKLQNNKNKLIGVCGLTYIDWKNKHTEISCYLNSVNWQKKKEARDTIHTILKYGFEELNLHRIWAEIFSTAQENIALFNKIGFVREGILRQKLWRDGKWWNSHIYSMLSSEFNKK